MPEAIIRRATQADYAALGIVGVAAYAESYCCLWDDPSGYASQLQSFGQATFESMPAETLVWVVEVEGWIVGFLKMLPDSPDPVEGRPKGTEIQRIYLLKPCRGLGLGLRLLQAAERDAKALESEYLWLVSMRSATWAWRTYEKWGFNLIGEKEFDKPVIASQRAMVVMRRDIDR